MSPRKYQLIVEALAVAALGLATFAAGLVVLWLFR